MRIDCPFCGPRDWSEFSCLGDASVRRPHTGTTADVTDAVYFRVNPAGRHEELWYHAFGCRGWLRVTRDTRTHEIFAVELCSEGVGA